MDVRGVPQNVLFINDVLTQEWRFLTYFDTNIELWKLPRRLQTLLEESVCLCDV